MNTNQQLVGDAPVRRFEYEDSIVLAADLGVEDAAVDVVGDTVIVVIGDEQHELTVPVGEGGETAASVNNGILSVEVSR